jgi:hypothetical protein
MPGINTNKYFLNVCEVTDMQEWRGAGLVRKHTHELRLGEGSRLSCLLLPPWPGLWGTNFLFCIPGCVHSLQPRHPGTSSASSSPADEQAHLIVNPSCPTPQMPFSVQRAAWPLTQRPTASALSKVSAGLLGPILSRPCLALLWLTHSFQSPSLTSNTHLSSGLSIPLTTRFQPGPEAQGKWAPSWASREARYRTWSLTKPWHPSKQEVKARTKAEPADSTQWKALLLLQVGLLGHEPVVLLSLNDIAWWPQTS